jgi:hypothetical protein
LPLISTFFQSPDELALLSTTNEAYSRHTVEQQGCATAWPFVFVALGASAYFRQIDEDIKRGWDSELDEFSTLREVLFESEGKALVLYSCILSIGVVYTLADWLQKKDIEGLDNQLQSEMTKEMFEELFLRKFEELPTQLKFWAEIFGYPHPSPRKTELEVKFRFWITVLE